MSFLNNSQKWIFWKPDPVETGHIQRYHGDPVLPVSTVYIYIYINRTMFPENNYYILLLVHINVPIFF